MPRAAMEGCARGLRASRAVQAGHNRMSGRGPERRARGRRARERKGGKQACRCRKQVQALAGTRA